MLESKGRKARSPRCRPRAALYPGHHAIDMDRSRNGDALHMRLGETARPRPAHPKGSYPLGQRPFHPRPGSILAFALCTGIPRTSRLEGLGLRAEMES